tara:strand:- start:42 stop:692 length:651 start_codon:yes stop_codon:yes gene_type:complete
VNIILFGPPGAGKGTQGDFLAKDLNLIKVSTGDLLRKEISTKSELGKKIDSIINKGFLAPDNIINSLIKNILSNSNLSNKLIFDGYPRTIEQAKNLNTLIKEYNQKISCVINLKVNEEIIFKRILGRQICSKCKLIFNEFLNPANRDNHLCDNKFLEKRSDDKKQIIVERFKTYKIESMPVLDFYRNENLLHEIDGMADIHDIYKEIRVIIDSLDT